MEISRKLIIVYYNHQHCLRKIGNFGNLIYHSNKLRYAYLYVDNTSVKSIIEKIKKINGVTKVELSLSEMSDFTFSL
ncbi:DUF2129 domain-containing protein [Mycoplasmatota bacterium]|nr:DUF2129 domain-containing protein [Mycoplasmatota bacterium]